MNIEWDITTSADGTYVMYRAWYRPSGRHHGKCVCAFFHNNEWRQTYLREPEFQSSSASIGEIPDTVKTVEEAKEYMLAMWRLQS